jgi:hypothetical protein
MKRTLCAFAALAFVLVPAASADTLTLNVYNTALGRVTVDDGSTAAVVGGEGFIFDVATYELDFDTGTVVTLTADPKGPNLFGYWDAGAPLADPLSTTLEITLDGDQEVTAYFRRPWVNIQDNDMSFRYPEIGGEVSISGATLFRDFFFTAASTNDIETDPNDPCAYGDWDGDNRPPAGIFDQLAPTYVEGSFGGYDAWWTVQYRGVGSGNGVEEFINFQSCGIIPSEVTSDDGGLNRFLYSRGGDILTGDTCAAIAPGACCQGDGLCTIEYEADCITLGGTFLGEFTECMIDGVPSCDAATALGCCDGVDVTTDADCAGIWAQGLPCDTPCDTGTPIWQMSIDFGVTDVPTVWFTVKPGDVAPDRAPLNPGYGANPILSWDTGFVSELKSLTGPCGESLNFNFENPDDRTVYDSQIAWSPIAYIANRGTDLENVTIDFLRSLFVSGRGSDGLNYVAVTRDAGSGTRNGAMNSICIDPAWGRGDNLGDKISDSAGELLGPQYQPTNKGGSSRMEGTVQNTRLAVGYTGLFGGSRAAADADGGRYELLNVQFDGADAGNFVRPGQPISNIWDNDDPNNGWRVGGAQTIASVGDPLACETGNPAVENKAAGDWLRNIRVSIRRFDGLGDDPEAFSPAEFLVTGWTLLSSADYIKSDTTCDWIPNPDLNPSIQDYYNDNPPALAQPAYGFGWNRVPTRIADPDWTGFDLGCDFDESVLVDGEYPDSATGAYFTVDGSQLDGGTSLNARNGIAADFDGDGARTNADISGMVEALSTDGTAWTGATPDACAEILGDLDADGLFTKADVRYFADGLATGMDGNLNREMGFTLVDTAAATFFGDGNFFGTVLSTGALYEAGDSRADIAGRSEAGPLYGAWPGARPHGQDCEVDCLDVTYICSNFGTWGMDTASVYDNAFIDLSADMNGDLVIDQMDIMVVVNDILEAEVGDVDLDGDKDDDDRQIIVDNQGLAGCWCDGDINFDGVVDGADLALFDGVEIIRGDADCSGTVNGFDIDPFVVALTDLAGWQDQFPGCPVANLDINCDGAVNGFDIDPFVECLTGACPPCDE